MKIINTIFVVISMAILTLIIIEAFSINFVFSEDAQQKTQGTNQVGIRDPFLSLLAKKADQLKKATQVSAPKKEEIKPPEILIQGLVWGKIQPQAIVNNKVVTVGDTINEAKIVDINKNGISILFKEKIFSISPSATEDGRKK